MHELMTGAVYTYPSEVPLGNKIPMMTSGETFSFERFNQKTTLYAVSKAVETGAVSDRDLQVLQQIAVASSGCMITRTLHELLQMRGLRMDVKELQASLDNLKRYQLIRTGRCNAPLGNGPTYITLTLYGAQIVRKFGMDIRFDPHKQDTWAPQQIKSYAVAAQLLSTCLKRNMVSEFSYRPVHLKDPEQGQIVRPSLWMHMGDNAVFCECPRHVGGWQEDLQDKLERYEGVFGRNDQMTVLICCENMEMCRSLSEAQWLSALPYEVMFTTDENIFGENFCFYSFDSGVAEGYTY